jgi:hypothetical protein
MNKKIPTSLATSLKISTKREHTHRTLLGTLLENTKIHASTQKKALPLITQKFAQKTKHDLFKKQKNYRKTQRHKFF